MILNRSSRARACVGGVLLVVLALSVGCASKDKKAKLAAGAEADKYLFDQGTDALNKRKWLRSREYFRQIVDNYPQSRYRADAKLGLGDTYLGDGSVESLILGANEFREFLSLYPTHERAYYAQYKLALSHYEQMLAPQRDQTQTKNAVLEFQTFVDRYSDSSLISEGRKRLQECRDRLSEADYQVGYFYFRSRWYPGAIVRFRAVMKDNPEYTKRDALYYYLAESYVKVGAPAEALPMIDRLGKEFEKSDYLAKAKQLETDIKNGTAASALKPPPSKKDQKKKDAKGGQ